MADLILMRKRIRLDDSPVLYDRPLSEASFQEDWEVRNSQWRYQDGAFWGENPQAAPGVIFSRMAFPGNVLVSFYAQTVEPSTHDIDVMWNMSWDEANNQRGVAYVAGLMGWWNGNVGIERSPEYTLIAAAPCPWFEAGHEYFIQAGSIDGHCFLFVDGILRLELTDPNPIDSSQHNRIGFEAYQSKIKVRDVVVRQIAWTPEDQSYPVEF
jgi:hypothetical protein